MPALHCYFFVALPCEAKPLISHFKLKKELSVTAFTIYRHAETTLVVTGVGKTAMAAGVAYTLARLPAPATQLPILLNIGIAGHANYKLGDIFTAEKMTDQETGQRYYPQLVVSPPWSTHALVTVAQVQPEYPTDALYEMEATAFYATAARFSSSELIHCIKVISDNRDNPSATIKPAQVSLWVSEVLPKIDLFIEQLRKLGGLAQQPDALDNRDILSRWHFTSSEKLQLQHVLNNRAILIPQAEIDFVSLQQTAKSAKQVLKYLRQEITTQAFGGF